MFDQDNDYAESKIYCSYNILPLPQSPGSLNVVRWGLARSRKKGLIFRMHWTAQFVNTFHHAMMCAATRTQLANADRDLDANEIIHNKRKP